MKAAFVHSLLSLCYNLPMNQSEISQYIMSQLQAGLTPADITTQLRNAGWQEADIETAFSSAQAQLVPAPLPNASKIQTNEPTQSTQQTPQQLPQPIKRGRIKTGWLLLKQSLIIVKTNPALWRYMIASMAWSILILLILFAILIFDDNNGQVLLAEAIENGETVYNPTLLGYAVVVPIVVMLATVTFYYATALSSHLLSIFKAQQTSYRQNIAVARKKLPAIFTFALMSVIVGYILKMIERNRLIGYIVAKIFGVIWTLGTVFVIPIIADRDENGASAVKDSVNLFKRTWGETIVGRIGLEALIYLFYLLIMFPVGFILVIIMGILFGTGGVLIVFALFIIASIVLGIISSLATNVINVSLYYYATYGAVPPSFNPELLASVFVPKKQKKQK